MEQLNQTLFLLLNAPADPSHGMALWGIFCAQYLVWLVPLALIALWLAGDDPIRLTLLQALLALGIGLLSNWLIGLAWQHPRPFAIGLGHNLVPHVANASFPSSHLTAWWSVAFSVCAYPRLRGVGIALSFMGLLIAWARIYVGVHYPLDMFGAVLVALFSARLSTRYGKWPMRPVQRMMTPVYQRLFAPLIRRGWARA